MPRRRQVGNYINVRLAAGRDTDLIDWWERVPDGAGGELVKQAIRQFIQGQASQTPTPATVADLERMAVWLVEQVKNLTPLTPSPLRREGEADDGARLDEQEVRERERKVMARRW